MNFNRIALLALIQGSGEVDRKEMVDEVDQEEMVAVDEAVGMAAVEDVVARFTVEIDGHHIQKYILLKFSLLDWTLEEKQRQVAHQIAMRDLDSKIQEERMKKEVTQKQQALQEENKKLESGEQTNLLVHLRAQLNLNFFKMKFKINFKKKRNFLSFMFFSSLNIIRLTKFSSMIFNSFSLNYS